MDKILIILILITGILKWDLFKTISQYYWDRIFHHEYSIEDAARETTKNIYEIINCEWYSIDSSETKLKMQLCLNKECV